MNPPSLERTKLGGQVFQLGGGGVGLGGNIFGERRNRFPLILSDVPLNIR